MDKGDRFMAMDFVPELLLPAGNLEKLKVALHYGAGAVYVGGQKFGLRSRADNFTREELWEGVTLAHQLGRKVYVVLNAFLHDKEMRELPEFVKYLDRIGVDAVIVSDLGVVGLVKEISRLPIHLSTQASCLNVYGAKFWRAMGVKRIIVGREMSIREAGLLKREAGVEVEMFIHGSLCMAYSGNCTISNYTSGRDSNRGGCAHSCRYEYSLTFENSQVKAFFMNSKDLQGLSLLPEFFEEKIDSVKVEGRMKNSLYVGTVAKIYAEAIGDFSRTGTWEKDKVKGWVSELQKMGHRGVTEANLIQKAGEDSVNWGKETEHEGEYQLVGNILEAHPGEFLLVEVKNPFAPGDHLELLPFNGPFIPYHPPLITSVRGEPVVKTSPNTLVKLPFQEGVGKYNILRKRVST